jgi:hypothetical protein
MTMFSSIDVIVQGEMHLPEQFDRREFTPFGYGFHQRHSEIVIVVYGDDVNQPEK